MTTTNPATNTGAALAPANTTDARSRTNVEEVLTETEKLSAFRLAFEPTTRDEARDEAATYANLKLCGVESEDDGYARIVIGRGMGLPAAAAIQSIRFFEDKKTGTKVPCCFVKAKVALILSRPDVIAHFRLIELTDKIATWEGKRCNGEPQKYSFTWEDAERAGLVGRKGSGGAQSGAEAGNNYDKHPKPMLMWRAAGRLADIIAGDILLGIASYEETKDHVEEVNAEVEQRASGVVPATVQAQVPVRDWAAEAEALKKDISAAVNDQAAMKNIRARFKVFKDDAPGAIGMQVLEHYNAVVKPPAAKPAAASTATASAASSPAPAATAAASPAAPASAAAPEHPWLPKHLRGDSYMGPDDPEPPFGAS
jgi:hypothetical protein